jgi:mRNA interferase YafQ
MYSFTQTTRFKRSMRRVQKFSRFKKEELQNVLAALQLGKKLPPAKKDHPLHGDLLGFRECHVQNDILLIYEINEDLKHIELYDIGTHSELFGV